MGEAKRRRSASADTKRAADRNCGLDRMRDESADGLFSIALWDAYDTMRVARPPRRWSQGCIVRVLAWFAICAAFSSAHRYSNTP